MRPSPAGGEERHRRVRIPSDRMKRRTLLRGLIASAATLALPAPKIAGLLLGEAEAAPAPAPHWVIVKAAAHWDDARALYISTRALAEQLEAVTVAVYGALTEAAALAASLPGKR